MEKKLFLVTTLGTRPSSFNNKHGFGRSNPLSGLSIQEKRKWTKEDNLPKPKRKILFNKNNIIIHEAFFEYNEGVIIIEAQNHKEAYDIYILMDFHLELFNSTNNFYKLEEINRIPSINHSINEFIKLLSRHENSNIEYYKSKLLYPKLMFGCREIKECVLFISKVCEDKIFIESIKHYSESIDIYGIWYGEVAYNDYRMELEWYKQYKDIDYNENGFKYELAFTAAFKGIECFFNVKDFKNKDDIQKAINKNDNPIIKADTLYKYMFEKDIDQIRTDKLEVVVGRYRDMRNASGAHNRMNLPIEKRIFRESVFEIQSLLRKLILTKYHNQDFLGFSY